jgi:hypothetical protein
MGEQDFLDAAMEIIGRWHPHRSPKPCQLHRRFQAFFGAWPYHCAIIWNKLRRCHLLDSAPARHVSPKHLLMGLHFLKAYNTEERSARTFGCDEKTFRQWAWFMVDMISKLESMFVSFSSLVSVFFVVLW